jgi:uncharacterized membrane protein
MRALVRSEVVVEAPAEVVWRYVTDWPRQGEWIPFTRVEVVPPDGQARDVGGRIRAWTGIGPVGFWDPMTITVWEEQPDGSARCEVLHRGRVVRGDGEFAVQAIDASRCRFVWWERLAVPGGPVGAVLWRLVGRAMQRGVDLALRRMARRAESSR